MEITAKRPSSPLSEFSARKDWPLTGSFLEHALRSWITTREILLPTTYWNGKSTRCLIAATDEESGLPRNVCRDESVLLNLCRAAGSKGSARGYLHAVDRRFFIVWTKQVQTPGLQNMIVFCSSPEVNASAGYRGRRYAEVTALECVSNEDTFGRGN